jgi:ankyrin repeat protein
MSYIINSLTNEFVTYCLNNDLINAKKIYNQDIIDINEIHCTISTKFEVEDTYSLFETMCIKNYIDIVKWLITIGVKDVYYNFGFISACIYDNEEIYIYLSDLNNTVIPKIKLDYTHAFMVCSFVGNFNVLKWLYANNKSIIDIHKGEESAFLYAIAEKHFNIVKWLYDLSVDEGNPINIRIDNDYAFTYACMYGNLEICKWLYEISSNTIDKTENKFMLNAELSNNQELINWLKT